MQRRYFLRFAGFTLLGSSVLVTCGNDPEPQNRPEPNDDMTLAFFGDSLTAGAGGSAPYGTYVGKALGNRPVLIEAIGGQKSAQIASRQGGLPLTISVENNAFNGTKTVTITKISNEFLSTAATVAEQTRKAVVAGVKCTIIRNATANPRTETYSIRPDAESTKAIPENSLVTLDNAVKTKTATQILWYGRNDLGSPTLLADVQSNLEQCIGYMDEPKRFIVLGILNGVLEISNTHAFKVANEVNTQLAASYGNQYVPMTAPTAEEMAAIGFTPSDQDKADIQNGVFPTGLRADRTHLNTNGYQIVANRVIAKLKELKY